MIIIDQGRIVAADSLENLCSRPDGTKENLETVFMRLTGKDRHGKTIDEGGKKTDDRAALPDGIGKQSDSEPEEEPVGDGDKQEVEG